MAECTKKTKDVKVWLPEDLELELRRLAERDERRLSDYIGVVLRRHVWGHVAPTGGDAEGTNRGE